jgi:hypothetical protein
MKMEEARGFVIVSKDDDLMQIGRYLAQRAVSLNDITFFHHIESAVEAQRIADEGAKIYSVEILPT